MKKMTEIIMAAGMILSIGISNICGFVSDGKELDNLRENVLRLHILADSDDDEAQRLKLCVRDALLERSDEIFGDAGNLAQAEEKAAENLELIEKIAVETLEENGCELPVSAEITYMYFDERTYGELTMPSGEYNALRVEIGAAEGHNWWCVMYPPLCIPAAYGDDVDGSTDTEEIFFDEKQQDILENPVKYRVRFALWDKIKEMCS